MDKSANSERTEPGGSSPRYLVDAWGQTLKRWYQSFMCSRSDLLFCVLSSSVLYMDILALQWLWWIALDCSEFGAGLHYPSFDSFVLYMNITTAFCDVSLPLQLTALLHALRCRVMVGFEDPC